MRYLQLDNEPVRLAYEVREPATARQPAQGGTRAPVVLVMGLAFASGAWAPQLPALSAVHPVLTFDNRGVGETEAPASRYRMETFADDAVRLLDHLGWPDAHWVGVSMGGMIVQTVALAHRARVRSLALICTHGGGLIASLASPRAQRWLLRVQLASGEASLRATQELLFPPAYLRHADRTALARNMRTALGQRPSRSHLLSQLHAMFRFRALPRLPSLAGLPTLILQGRRDILIHPQHSERLQRAIPGSRLICFPEGAHGLTLQYASSVNRLLLAHFASADRVDPNP